VRWIRFPLSAACRPKTAVPATLPQDSSADDRELQQLQETLYETLYREKESDNHTISRSESLEDAASHTNIAQSQRKEAPISLHAVPDTSMMTSTTGPQPYRRHSVDLRKLSDTIFVPQALRGDHSPSAPKAAKLASIDEFMHGGHSPSAPKAAKFASMIEAAGIPVGSRVVDPTRGPGLVAQIDMNDPRGKPIIIVFDSREVHHYSMASASKLKVIHSDEAAPAVDVAIKWYRRPSTGLAAELVLASSQAVAPPLHRSKQAVPTRTSAGFDEDDHIPRLGR
jgi:hypothetical protein